MWPRRRGTGLTATVRTLAAVFSSRRDRADGFALALLAVSLSLSSLPRPLLTHRRIATPAHSHPTGITLQIEKTTLQRSREFSKIHNIIVDFIIVRVRCARRDLGGTGHGLHRACPKRLPAAQCSLPRPSRTAAIASSSQLYCDSILKRLGRTICSGFICERIVPRFLRKLCHLELTGICGLFFEVL